MTIPASMPEGKDLKHFNSGFMKMKKTHSAPPNPQSHLEIERVRVVREFERTNKL